MERIESLLNNYLGNSDSKEFKSIIAYDIFMHLSDAVLSGGVRRSAMNIIMDANDEQLVNAKTGNWREKTPWRARSNNSVALKRGTFSKKTFKDLLDKNQGDNDVGFVFVNNEDEQFNPCFEIGFNFYDEILDKNEAVFQFCVSGNTKLITRNGIESIKDAVGKEIEIWNGQEWSKVKPYQTGTSDRLHRVHFSDGSYLDATDNHKFLVKNRFQDEFKEVDTLELQELLKTSKYGLQSPRSNIIYEDGEPLEYAYDYGFFIGDGYIDGNYAQASLYNEDKKILFNSDRKFNRTYTNSNGVEYEKIKFNNLDLDFCNKLKYNKGLPDYLFSLNKESILKFIAGWADADGSQASKGIRIYGNEDNLRDAQLLLSKIGINSSVNLQYKEGEESNLGVRLNDVWFLQITKTFEIPCQRLICDNDEPVKKKGKYQIVKKIETLDGEHLSYCLTEDKLHQCVFNNVLTKQCNLNEINASACTFKTTDNFSKDKFFELCRKAAIVGTLQAGYTHFPYLGKQTDEIVAGEALIGVSITGWMMRPELFDEELLREGAKIVKETNKEVAEVIGINTAARCTTVKPSGNASTVLMTESGIHPAHSKRGFRLMQLNKESDTGKYLEENYPEILEESVWSATNTDWIVYATYENPEGTLTKEDMKGVEHLKLIELVQNSWINEGKREERCYNKETSHNVSNTVIIDNRDEIINYLYEHQNNFAAVSFLDDKGDKEYNQAPFTSVMNTEELVDEYGDGVVFMSGLIVDGLHYFNNDLWNATEHIKNEDMKLIGTRTEVLLKKDWLRRAKKFAKNYFDGDMEKMIYCMKNVHLWHKFSVVNRVFKPVDFQKILDRPTYQNIDKYGSMACSGGQCEIPDWALGEREGDK